MYFFQNVSSALNKSDQKSITTVSSTTSAKDDDMCTEDPNDQMERFEEYLRRAKIQFELKFHLEPLNASSECLDDYDVVRLLGAGCFGQVALAINKKSSQQFCAVKFIEKRYLVSTNQVKNLVNELNIMKSIDFHFLVDMQYFFVENVYVCIVMQFINGGDMFTHLRENRLFKEDLSKFYAAQVVLAFEYLHMLGIIHRDLKPENILLDSEGYIKITDFGFSKKLDGHRTYTLCGTPEYLAPEIILNQGYGASVDWWALGILIFEMTAGYPPFYSHDHIRLYEKIICGKINYPNLFSKPLKDLLKNMLDVDKSKRYGNLKRGVRDIKGHEWFKTIDFDKLYNRQLVPMYKPELNGETDTKYFHAKPEINLRKCSTSEYDDTFKDLF